MVRAVCGYLTLVVTVYTAYQYRGFDICNKQSNCSGCISFAPYCSWCSDQGEEDKRRCRRTNIDGYTQQCNNLVNPGNNSGIANITENLGFREKDADDNIIQVKPQHFKAAIRNGSSVQFTVSVQPATDFPLDLYFLMDHSFSMKPTLDVLKKSVDAMSEKLKVLTKDHKIGFGTFVDKTTAPFIYTTVNKLKNPCGPDTTCPPAYNFNNTVNLNEYEKFKVLIEASKVSASVDLPEAGMDALMQVAVCKDEIGWRKHSRKVIVYLTDTGFHFAGDGKLGGQVERNDGKCWMEDGRTYSKEKINDYPSIHQVVKKMVDNQMIPIFGVTKQVLKLYEDLQKLFPYGTIGELATDSNNLVNLIVENYRNISSEIAPLIRQTPKKVKVEHVAFCPNSAEVGLPNGVCSDVSINDTAHFVFTVTAEACLEKEEQLVIELTGFGKVALDLSTLCTCECSSDLEGSTAPCGGNGLYKCGACICNDNFFGSDCSCTGSDTGDIDGCKTSESNTLCSGRGQCLCGSCDCEDNAFGPHCECDEADCRKGANGLTCSGHGECMCFEGEGSKCNCEAGWENDDCGCTTDTTDCMFNGRECDGKGTCVCGKCQCDEDNYAGKYCQLCPYCDKCLDFKECVICVAGTSDVAPKDANECDACDVAYEVSITTEFPDDEDLTVELSPDMEKRWCTYDEENCQYNAYYMQGPKNQTRQLIFINMDIDCHTPVNILWIIIGVVCAVVVLGIFIICLWKCITMYKDKQEYKKFIEDMNMTKFASTQSPLYECPITHVQNPIAKKM